VREPPGRRARYHGGPVLVLHNPHAVEAAIEIRPADVHGLIEGTDRRSLTRDPAWRRVFALARRRGIEIRSPADSPTPRANVKERPPASLPEIFAHANRPDSARGVWFLIDRLDDRRNIGSIIRSAAFFGLQGVVIHGDEPGISAEIYDHACGGIEHVRCTVQPDLARILDAARTAGVSILATDSEATHDLDQVPRDRPWMIVLGNEEGGVSEAIRASCTLLCRIPAVATRTCLNVAVAAGIFAAALTGAARSRL
jgi:23S rRNA (guanosine2251-2'-O)-methyltransferase